MRRYMVITRNSVYSLVPMPRTGGLMATGGILGTQMVPYNTASIDWDDHLVLEGGPAEHRRGPGWIRTSLVQTILVNHEGDWSKVDNAAWQGLRLCCPAPAQRTAIAMASRGC